MATIELSRANFDSTVSQQGTVLVDLWAPWCGPCRTFAPVYEKASEKYPEAVFAKVNTEEHGDLASALQVRSIPTLMIFRDGILLYRQPGALPEAALDDLLTQVANLDMDEVRRKVDEQDGQQGE